MTRAYMLAMMVPALLVGRTAAAEESAKPDSLPPRRFEYAGAPIVAGNTDIGVQLGVAGSISRFYDNATPYLWNVDFVLSSSVKSDNNGLRLVQHSYVARLDAPDLWGGLVRLDNRVMYQRTINAGYFGLGNTSSAEPGPGTESLGRRYQYLLEGIRSRSIARIHAWTPVDLALGMTLRYEMPEAFEGTKLAEDATRGLRPAFLGGLAAGIMVDTRDSEFITRHGIFYQLGIGGTGGTAESIRYGQAAAILAHYASLGGPVIFASRMVASFEAGNVPFYDLQQGGVFEPQGLLGGEAGVRGVPQGRYAGLVKLVSNNEIRTVLPRFQLFGQRLRFGTTTFFDAGRAWTDYTANAARDGRKLGLKIGVGGGLFLQWGEAAIFRIEAAYSPDAVSENPGFPVGIYIADGLMF